MDETIIFPSPNWFQVSGIATSRDNWFVYGGPSKSLCVLKPIDSNYEGVIQGSTRYQAHVVNRAHSEKIISVDISREWPEKRYVLTGSIDGSVKQWNIENVNNSLRIKSTHNHDIHQNEKEEVSGVGYSSDSYAITVGCFGTVVKWDLNSNVVNSYKSFLKTFKPNCMTCSQHIPLNVAIGTRQGVVFVLDLTGKGKVIYKVRAQDDEIVNISWCPQFDILLKKSLTISEKKSAATERLEKIRSTEAEGSLNKSAVTKNLPEDSFDESIVEEDDMFDIYKDHEPDEFGHSKYVPQDILVKVKEQKENSDFLADCLKLKSDILKKKDEEPSIASLVDALDNTHVHTENSETQHNSLESDGKVAESNDLDVSSAHTHKHLLATIGKYGSVKIWSKSGKLVASCNVPYTPNNKGQKNKGVNSNTILWYKPDVLLIGDGKSQLLECNPLKIDCKNRIEWRILHTLHKRGLYCITTNASKVQSSDQPEGMCDDWKIYTAAQDRNIVCYSYEKKQKEVIYSTCGGFLYAIHSCPYDAKKLAIGVGDGAVRVWEADTLISDDEKLAIGNVTSYWQNVQGKVLTIVWHPTRENLLAFGTGESRIGILDTSGKTERPAKTLQTALRGGVYSLCWGENYDLYACGGGELVVYHTDKPEQDAKQVPVALDGTFWQITSVAWTCRGLLCGSDTGALALLNTEHQLLAVAFVFNKMVHSIEWHPQQTSSDSEESPYKDLIAVSSLDKANNIVILEYVNDGKEHKLNTWKVLSGHKSTVLQLTWNPHKDDIIMSSSQDATVRVWDITQGICISIFGNHSQSSLGLSWSAFPHLSTVVYSGGADCCLRAWNYENYPPEKFAEIKHEVMPKKEKKKNKDKKEENKVETVITEVKNDSKLATALDINVKKKNYKKFLLPSLARSAITIESISKMSDKYLKGTTNGDTQESNNGTRKMDDDDNDIKKYMNEINRNKESIDIDDDDDDDLKDDSNDVKDDCFEMDFIKLFGTTNEFNELLDLEVQKHQQMRRCESYTMLCIFRGHIDAMVQYAAQRDALCPFIVSVTPCVSFKYWKDITQMYLAQIERLDARNEVEKIFDNKHYGGPVYRKVALHLSLHDIKSAVNLLLESRLYKEAYVLARARHVDSVAQEVLWKWSMNCVISGNHKMTAMCHLALGDPHKAAIALAKVKEEEFLSLAAKLAQVAGQTTFASHIEEKRSQIQSETPEVENLKPLPSKIDVMAEDINKSSKD